MKTIYYLSLALLYLISLAVSLSCDAFVEVDLPKSQLISDAVFEDYNTASSALTDIYSSIRDKGILSGGGTGVSNLLGNYTDELTSSESPSNPSLNFYNNSLLPANTYIRGHWNSAYNQIYAANALMEGLQRSKNLTIVQKNQLRGEALFIRALEHFFLVNIFGDIPYITSTDYNSNSKVSRTPAATVYQNVLSDLNESLTLLPKDYILSERIRPNYYTVKALLARVYLYGRLYPEAADSASAVLNQHSLYSLSNVQQAFLINSIETIWQLHAGTAGKNTAEAAYFTFTATPPPQVSLTSSLTSSFEPSDLRRLNWIKAVTGKAGIWHQAYKYKENNNTASSKEYSIMFRLAEQYLIRSEARANQGDLIGAKEDLNKIRNRAGLADTTAETKEQILSALLEERKHELFTEQGHRFFDLKRNGILDLVLTGTKKGWNTEDNLFPIPQLEINVNPNLRPQNPGY